MRPSAGDGNRAPRKAIDIEHIAVVSSKAQTVKPADLINDCLDITKLNARFARGLLSEMTNSMGV